MTGDFETRFIWNEYERMGVDAVSPGPRELSAWSTFHDLVGSGKIPVIESNVFVRKDGREVPIGETSHVFTVNGVRVAVFSLMGGGEFATVGKQEGVEFAFHDPLQTAVELVPKLRQQADMVVLMSQMAPGDSDRLIKQVKGIDVALYGQRAGWEEKATEVDGTIVNQTGIRGQYIGQLVLIVNPEGKIVDFGSRNAPLDGAFPQDDAVAKQVEETSAKVKEMKAEARQKRQSEFENKLSGERYLGADTCKRCHLAEYKQWEETPHAHAFASLKKPVEGKSFGPACVGCHATGSGDPAGFHPDLSSADLRPASSPDLANVQCEACHGRGTEHLRTGHVQVAESTCRSCHTADWSPSFDFQSALAQVRH